eukprot:363701-Chlamydomonas_euryale.AAC.7
MRHAPSSGLRGLHASSSEKKAHSEIETVSRKCTITSAGECFLCSPNMSASPVKQRKRYSCEEGSRFRVRVQGTAARRAGAGTFSRHAAATSARAHAFKAPAI